MLGKEEITSRIEPTIIKGINEIYASRMAPRWRCCAILPARGISFASIAAIRFFIVTAP
ncbi:hypothetical protein D3C81_2311640 [compost metagenome]